MPKLWQGTTISC